jgi:hypothetical protein
MRAELRRARALVEQLQLPDPWDVEQLCERVAQSRQRPVRLLARPVAGDSITASVFAAEHADYIFYRDDLRALHRDHAVCHELGHLLAGHTDGLLDRSVGELSEHTVTQLMLRRDCAYGDAREREAETIADLIMDRVSRRVDSRTGDPVTRRIVRGFGDALR